MPKERSSAGRRLLRDLRVVFGMQNDAFLLVRIRASTDQEGRGPLTAVDGHVEHAGRDVHEVARPSHLPMLE
jgi:hypothetical protein